MYCSFKNCAVAFVDRNGLDNWGSGGQNSIGTVWSAPIYVVPPMPSVPSNPTWGDYVGAFFDGFIEGLNEALTSPEYLKCQATCSLDVFINAAMPIPIEIRPGQIFYQYGDEPVVGVDVTLPADLAAQYYKANFEKLGGQASIDRMTDLLNRPCSKLGERHRKAMQRKLLEAKSAKTAAGRLAKLNAAIMVMQALEGYWDCYNTHCKKCLGTCNL